MSPADRGAIADADALVAVSAATVWEIALERAIGTLRFDGSITPIVAREAFEPLPIAGGHAERAGQLPLHHRDPFRRMLVAQAQSEDLRIVTRDPAFDADEVPVLRC